MAESGLERLKLRGALKSGFLDSAQSKLRCEENVEIFWQKGTVLLQVRPILNLN